ncbi:MAG: hypothetical protein OXE50_14960, partial [Chloroflexi bacterium]|nr:hypothetical protein [Chloroflexota bacterium]
MRRSLAAAPLIVVLLAILFMSPVAQAQTRAVECATALSDGSYSVPHDWALKPAGLAGGVKFRLLFLTSTKRDATATDIATYNSYVQTRAKAGHSAITDGCGNKFKVVGSTSTVDARANVDAESGDTDAAIYWLNGAKAADNHADFWDGSWDSHAARTESGGTYNFVGQVEVWTGSNANGTRSNTAYLGLPVQAGNSFARVQAGSLHSVAPNAVKPVSQLSERSTINSPFYALSPVFKAERAPPPSAGSVSVRRKAATGASIPEGANAVFTFTAKWSGTRATPLKIAYAVVDKLDTPLSGWNPRVPSSHRGVKTLDIPAAGSVDLSIPTQADGTDLEGRIDVLVMDWRSDDAVTERYTGGRDASVRVTDGPDTPARPAFRLLHAWDRAGKTKEDIVEGESFKLWLLADRASASDVTVRLSITEELSPSWRAAEWGPQTQRNVRAPLEAGDFITPTHVDVTIPAGQTRATVVVPTVNDTVAERTGKVTMAIVDRAAYDVDTRFSTIVYGTVRDDDPSTVSFIYGASGSREADGRAHWGLGLSIVPAAREAFTMTVSLGGTATRGQDYRLGGGSGTTATFTVPARRGTVEIPLVIIDDNIEDSGETVVLTLQSGSGYRLGGRTAHTHTIRNHD